MKKYLALFLMPLMAACTVANLDEQSAPVVSSGSKSFTVGIESVGKAALNGLQPEWVANDLISVFAEGKNQPYAAATGGAAAKFDFVATEIDPTPATASEYYFLYPYTAEASAASATINTVIPNCQTAVKDGICPAAMVMVGKTTGNALSLKNCVALVKITLSDSNASTVVLTSNSGEKIAGKVSISLAGEVPAVTCTGSSQVLLTPAAGAEKLEAGTYYVAVAPTAVAGGLNALVIKDDEVYTASSTNALSFARSEVMSIGDLSTIAQRRNTHKITIDFFKTGKMESPFVDANGVKISLGNSFADGKVGTYPNTEFNLYTLEEDGGFQFSGFAKRGLGQNSSQGFRFLLSEEDYLRLPAINGMKLSAVRVLDGTGNYNRFIGLANTTDASFMKGCDSYNQDCGYGNGLLTWYNPEAEAGAEYDLRVKNVLFDGGLCSIKKLELFYEGTAQPSVKAVKTGESKLDETTGNLIGSFTQFGEGALSGASCGFEYREIGATAWTSVTSGETVSSFSAKVDGLDASKQYEVRAFVKDGSRTIYGDICKLSSANEYVLDFATASTNWANFFDNTILPLPTANTPNYNVVYPIVMLSGDHLACEAMVDYNEGKKSSLYIDGGLTYSYSRRTSYLALPAINGLTLTKVVITLGSATTSGKFCIQKMDDSKVTNDLTWTANADNTFETAGLAPGERVKLALKNEKNGWVIKKVTLTYAGKALPTVTYVCPPSVSGGAISGKCYVNTATSLSNVTAGFEIKSGDAFTALTGGACAGTDGIINITGSASVASGSIIRAWSSVDGGTTKVYSNEYTVE